jgi:hypothetical protein
MKKITAKMLSITPLGVVVDAVGMRGVRRRRA